MKIRVRKSFGIYKSGQEFDWPRGMCRLLIARGLIEEVAGPSERKETRPADDSVEEAAIEPAVEQAVIKKKRKPK